MRQGECMLGIKNQKRTTMKTSKKILGLLALAAFATACEDPFKPQMDPPSNPLMGYKWVNVWERVIDGENTTSTNTFYFETDSTGKLVKEFKAPGYRNRNEDYVVYTFEGDSGSIKCFDRDGINYNGTDKITYERTKHELYWWRWRTYDGRRDSAMVLTRYSL